MKSLILIITIALSTQGFTQQKLSLDLETTASFINGTFRLISSPQVSVIKNNHSISLGPAFITATEVAVSDKNFPKLAGLQGSYHFYPIRSGKKLNFYLYDDLLVQRIKEQWTSSIWNQEILSYGDYKYSSIEWIVQNHVGYGLDLLIANHIVLSQSVGLGAYYSLYDGNEVSEEAPDIGDENVNGYSPIGFSWQVKFGVGFVLK